MSTLLDQNRALLAHQFEVLSRLESGLQWSLERVPAVGELDIHDPQMGERLAAIVDRFTKLQDQFAGALRHAHGMLGEKTRSFADVVSWAVKQNILPDNDTWLELRSLRNRLTHEYELDSQQLPELLSLIRDGVETIRHSMKTFKDTCQSLALLEQQS